MKIKSDKIVCWKRLVSNRLGAVRKTTDTDPIYAEINDKVYSLRGHETDSPYTLATAPKNRTLPDLPAGSRGKSWQESY